MVTPVGRLDATSTNASGVRRHWSASLARGGAGLLRETAFVSPCRQSQARALRIDEGLSGELCAAGKTLNKA